MVPIEEVRGEFQGQPYVVRLGHLSATPEKEQGPPDWWFLEFGGKRSVLMAATPGDIPDLVARRAEERLQMPYG